MYQHDSWNQCIPDSCRSKNNLIFEATLFLKTCLPRTALNESSILAGKIQIHCMGMIMWLSRTVPLPPTWRKNHLEDPWIFKQEKLQPAGMCVLVFTAKLQPLDKNNMNHSRLPQFFTGALFCSDLCTNGQTPYTKTLSRKEITQSANPRKIPWKPTLLPDRGTGKCSRRRWH